MPKRRSSLATIAIEPFAVRWHTIANPATPSEEIMSSPDPLNEADITIPVPPSSRRITRSQRSNKFVSHAKSPTKQMFELEVGNNNSPQRLLITVETEKGKTSGARRRLFPSSSPFAGYPPAMNATTTTVPLKESIEDESMLVLADPEATPKERGQPRKSNGTPMPGAGKRRKAGNPFKQRTPRRNISMNDLDPLSDPVVQLSPTPKRWGRPPKKRAAEPSSDIEFGSTLKNGSTRRKRRRQALGPEKMEDMAEEEAEAPIKPREAPDDLELDLIELPQESAGRKTPSRLEEAAPPRSAGGHSDIWMATMSPEKTPRPRHQSKLAPSGAQTMNRRSSPSADLASVDSNADIYELGAPSVSDESDAAASNLSYSLQNNDTIAQGEDFSMIFMDSVQSYQDFKSSVAGPNPKPSNHHQSDIGEETNIIINNSMVSFRQSLRQQETGEEEHGESVEEHQLEAHSEDDMAGELPERRDEFPEEMRPETEVVYAEKLEGNSVDVMDEDLEELRSDPDSEASHDTTSSYVLVRTPQLAPNESTSAVPKASPFSQSTNSGATSSKKTNNPGLLQRVLQRRRHMPNAQGAGHDEVAVSPGLKGSPRRRHSGRLQQDEYEDSFSEIPQDVLAAATPREANMRRGAASLYTSRISDEGSNDDLVLVDHPERLEPKEVQSQQQEPAAQSQPPDSSNGSSAAHTDDGKLPTPDDTPPNLEMDVSSSSEISVEHPITSSSPEPHAQLESDHNVITQEPEITEQQRPQVSRRTITPINQMSSPAEQPSSMAESSHAQEKAARPPLEAILRASRVMQSVTSDPPSPEGRDNQLRSPFRSSASKESPSGSKEAHAGHRISMSPARRGGPFSAKRQLASAERSNEDPFVGETLTRHGLSFNQNPFMQACQSANQSPKKFRASPQGLVASYRHPASLPSRKHLSVGDSVNIESATSLIGSSVREIASPGQINGAADERHAPLPQIFEDETDIWDIQADLSIARDSQQNSYVEKPTLESEQTRRTSLHQRPALPEDWMVRPPIAQKENSQGASKSPASVQQTNRFQLSAFFSPPAAVPRKPWEKPAEKSSVQPSRASMAMQAEKAQATPNVIQTSSMFPQISQVPQKEFRPRSSSRTDLFSPAKSKVSQAKSQDSLVEPQKVSSMYPSLNQRKNEFAATQTANATAAKPTAEPAPRASKAVQYVQGSTSGATTPPKMQLSRADIQRWQMETSDASDDSPRESHTLNPLRPLPARNASPHKSSLRSPLKPHTPGRVVEFTSSVLSPFEQVKARQQRPHFTEDHGVTISPTESQSQLLPQSHPQPQANTGYNKEVDIYSNNRSTRFLARAAPPAYLPRPPTTQIPRDYSAHTVDAAQAEAATQWEHISQSKFDRLCRDARRLTLEQQREKEMRAHESRRKLANGDSDAWDQHSSAATQGSTKVWNLSWTPKHWQLLEMLVNMRRVEPFPVDYPPYADDFEGKHVVNGGRSVEFKRWHVECVNAFGSLVEGWDSRELAKRVGSLVFAADSRAGPVDDRAMFH